MITVISKKNKIAAEIICDVKNLKNPELKKIKFALNNFGMIYFKNQNLSSSNYLKFAKKLGIPADYPRLKGLSSKYNKITVVERKIMKKLLGIMALGLLNVLKVIVLIVMELTHT